MRGEKVTFVLNIFQPIVFDGVPITRLPGNNCLYQQAAVVCTRRSKRESRRSLCQILIRNMSFLFLCSEALRLAANHGGLSLHTCLMCPIIVLEPER